MQGYAIALGALAVAAGLVVGIYGLSRLLTSHPQPLDAPPFLSGLDPREHAASRFHMRWYPVTLIFLAFDMEMVIMFPWTRVVRHSGHTDRGRDVPVPHHSDDRCRLRLARRGAAMDVRAWLTRAAFERPRVPCCAGPGRATCVLVLSGSCVRAAGRSRCPPQTPTSCSSLHPQAA